MMTSSRMKRGSEVMSYFSAHLSEVVPNEGIEDYYIAEGDPGHWHGGGLARVNLAQGEEVSAHTFRMISAGFTPDGRGRLAQNAGSDNRLAGQDLTFSAPKSVSVIWALLDRESRKSLEDAHQKAVKKALDVLEQKAFYVRAGRDGEDVQHARMIASLFRHGTSRELDPQLHTHAFVMNLGVRADGKTSAIDPITIMRWQKAIGAVYRAQLAENLRTMGYTIERDGDSFRVAGVSHGVAEDFSQRRQQILEKLRELGMGGARAAQNAALETRQAKAEVPLAQLEMEWATRAAALGLSRDQAAALRADEPTRLLEQVSGSQLLDRITTHDAVFGERQLWQHAAEQTQGAGNIEDARLLVETARALAVELDDPVTGERVYTTRELLQAEREIVQSAVDRAEDRRHVLSAEAVGRAVDQMQAERSTSERPFELRTEQRQAVLKLTTTQGATQILVGDAGTGKSTALEAVQRAYSTQGYRLVGAALAGKAAASLEEDSGIASHTIDRLLHEIDSGRVILNDKTVLVVDEAAMIDSRKMAEITRHVEQAGAKLILVGDHKQLQPVGAGATFRHLAEQLPEVRLEQIGRQREEWAREAVRQMSSGEAGKALRAYISAGDVSVTNTHRNAVIRVARQYLADRDEIGADKCQVIASTNSHVRDLNQEIRARLKQQGELSGAAQVSVQASGKEEGREKIELAAGERVVITRNLNSIGLKNGDFATVREVGADRLVLDVDRLGRGLGIKLEEVSLRHGYAATTHKLQGATVERAVVLGSEQTSREMAYVQASRSKDATRWVFSAAKLKKMEAVVDDGRLAKRQDSATIGENGTSSTRQMLERLKHVTDRMAHKRQKVSTLDYRHVERSEAEPVGREIAGALQREQERPRQQTQPQPHERSRERGGNELEL